MESLEIVISGLSGRFPESCHVEEFAQNLFGGMDMITDDGRRWTPGYLGLPPRSGKLKELEQFDADFFGVHAKQADFMDPQLRMLLEVTQEAIIDAGVNPQDIRGQNVGVFVGACHSDSEGKWIQNVNTSHGYSLSGCQRTMFSNRVSFAFDFKGPSFTIDTACSSSLMALEQAFTALKSGRCDSAIVGGTHLCLDPNMSLQFKKLNMLSPEGKCQSFDASGDGYVRSEAVVAIFIQRKNAARRHYASILGVKTNTDGHKAEGVTYPSGRMQKLLLEATYKEAGVDPRDVVYVEAHGTGTPAGDPQELNAISEVFCPGRDEKNQKPLLIGSVKSNMGHAEPASGLCGIAKVLLAMQRGVIPGNLHYKTPNQKINALKTGQLKVVSENTEWNGGIVGINSFGFGGANVDAILQSCPESRLKKDEQVAMEIPLIIPFSGRSQDSVEMVLKEMSTGKTDDGKIRLLHEIYSKNIPGHQFRGFAVLPQNQEETETEISVQEIQTPLESPSVWFIFNGMGSQWAGMGKSLMKFQTCKKSLEKSAAVLKTKNLDLFDLLINGKEDKFENVLNSFVSIAAIQIALVDLLTSLKIKPDGIIGHSVGELGAAYADDCMTAEQVILTANARGQAILDMETDGLGDGAMLAVGLSWEEAKKKCPDGIYPACHNSKDSVTVSGPAKLIDEFIQQLTTEGIFARKVNSSGQAFHSKYIEPAKINFKESLDKIIPVPAPRSSRWISSSIPESEWNSELSKTSSVDYHVNNLISPVLFQEALEKVPSSSSSVVIEIGPHCLLQAILKRSLPNCAHIGLLNKNHRDKDGSTFLCNSIGKMFNFGLNPSLSNLYPQAQFQFPVPLETGSLSSVVSKCWDHSKSWNVASFSENSAASNFGGKRNNSGGSNFEISLDNEQDAFYAGHKIDGRIIFPQTGLIVLAWRAWAEIHGNHGNADFQKIPFTIENLIVSRATMMPKKGEVPLKFNVSITQSTGEFRIEENGILVASGTIRSPLDEDLISVGLISDLVPIPGEKTLEIVLNQQDFYKFMRLRGYEYSPVFQRVQRISVESGWAEVEFSGSNWVAFLDGLLHLLHPLGGCHGDKKSLLLPTRLKKLVVDPQKLMEHLRPLNENSSSKSSSVIPAFHNPNIQLIFCEGVQIQGQKLEAAPRNQQQNPAPVLEKFEFTPHFDDTNVNSKNTDDSCLQTLIGLVLENIPGDKLNVLETVQSPRKMISGSVLKFCTSQPKKTCDAAVVVSDFVKQNERENSGIRFIHKNPSAQVSEILKSESDNRNLVIVHDLKDFKQVVENEQVSKFGTFLLLQVAKPSEESRFQQEIQTLEDIDMTKVAHKISPGFDYYLFRKFCKPQSESKDSQRAQSSNISVDTRCNSSDKLELNQLYRWVENLKVEMKKAAQDKILIDDGFRINVISRSFDSDELSFSPSGILGLVNSLRREAGGQALFCFLINDSNAPAFDFQNPDQDLQTVIQRDLLMNVYQNGVWGSFRFFPLPPPTTKPVENAYLNFQTRGDLSSFQWFESPLKYSKNSKENLCSVYYSALNFRDVMLASGKLNPGSLPNNLGNADCVLGMEFSGLDSAGKRVMGILPAKAMATCVVPDPGFLWEVPSSLVWSLADAATVPVAYATAYYALVVRGRLKEGESLLIHGGAGAVGLAAISIAVSKNCRVFTTVGSMEKREFLKNNFPQLNDSSFANSRDASFLQHIMEETKGRGVDIVLNSLAGDKLLASIECVAQHGRFLELGKVDLFNDSKLGMSIFLKNVNFSGILLDSLTSENEDQRKTWELVQQGIESRVVQPLKHTIFSDGLDEVEKAFRFMASGKHIGKILIEMRKEEEKPHEKTISALSRTYFHPLKSYIILGGLGGFGLELCDWLIQRGATKLMLISRSGVTTGYQKLCLNRWTKSKVSVLISTFDATTHEGATKILKTALEHFKGAPIGGIFNLAMVLRDGVMENQTPENFDAVAKPKINASMAMDKASRILAPELEYFVCFSSIVSGRGAPGLSNYAWANSALERICEQRKKEGLPGLTIQWGAIGDVGVMVEKLSMKNDESVEGTAPQRIASCLNTLDIFLQSSLPIKLKSKSNGGPTVQDPPPSCSTLSSFVLAPKSNQKLLTEDHPGKTRWMESIARILGLKVEELEKNPEKPFSAFGMDSLMTTEVQQFIEVTCKKTISNSQLANFCVSKLRVVMATGSKVVNENHPETPSKSLTASTETLPLIFESKSKAKTPTNVEQQNPKNSSSLNETEKKPKRSYFVSMALHENFRQIVAYSSSILIVIILYLILSPISSLLQQSVKIWLWLFHDATQIKLVDGLGESTFIVDNINVVQIYKFSGLPDKDQLLHHLEQRLFAKSTDQNESNEPFERLKWGVETGFLFCYWRKDENFELSRHVVFEESTACDLDREMPRLADYYLSLKWDKVERPGCSNSNSNSSPFPWQSKPWWEFRIVSSENAGEFLMVFACNHVYGDGRSMVKLFQQILTKDGASVLISKQCQIKNDQNSVCATPKPIESFHFRMLEGLNTFGHFLTKSRDTFHKTLRLTHVFAHHILQTWDTRNATFSMKSHTHKASAYGQFSLSKVKGVKNGETGNRYNLNAVVLSICARVYGRILKESKSRTDETMLPLPYELLPNVTWAPFENSHSDKSLVNDMLMTPIKVPVTFDTFDSFDTTNTDLHETFKITQENLARAGKMKNLLAFKQILQRSTQFPLPLLHMLTSIGGRCSFVYSNVLAVVPKSLQVEGALGQDYKDYKLMDIYGFLPPSPLSLLFITDSVNDSLKGTLTVSDVILHNISPQFHRLFFPYFEQEMNNL